jgi:2'-5' RNA ligase
VSGVRTFVGMPLPGVVKDALALSRDEFVACDHSWRDQKWVSTENLHITLKFVGDVGEDALGDLADAVEVAARAHTAFELPLGPLRAVPNARRASMLWLTFLDSNGLCGLLAADVERAVLAFGATPEARTFAPHATLVRARAPRCADGETLAAAQQAMGSAPKSVSVRSVTLFASELTRHGPIYSMVRACPLRRG